MMYKKGQAVFIGLMVSIALIVLLVNFLPVISTQTSEARSNLDCTNSSISVGTQITCVVIDTTLWYWFGTALAVGIGYLFVKYGKPTIER